MTRLHGHAEGRLGRSISDHDRTLVDEQHEGDVGRCVERAIALADLDRLETAAVLQALLDRLRRRRIERLPDGDAGELMTSSSRR